MPAGALDLLAVVESMAAHFEERHQDVVRWSWKLFCAKWVRLLEAQRRRQIEEREREEQQERQRLAELHRQRHGG